MPRLISRPQPKAPALWWMCQKIVYPKRVPSKHPPFNKEECSAKKKKASFLYHLLLEDSALRWKFIILEQIKNGIKREVK